MGKPGANAFCSTARDGFKLHHIGLGLGHSQEYLQAFVSSSEVKKEALGRTPNNLPQQPRSYKRKNNFLLLFLASARTHPCSKSLSPEARS